MKLDCVLEIKQTLNLGNKSIFLGNSLGNKTPSICERSPLCNGYYVLSELNDVLQSKHYSSLFGYDKVD